MSRLAGTLQRAALLACSASTGLAAACAIPLFGSAGWVRVPTPHFEVLGSAGARQARELAADLERFRALVLPLRNQAPEPPRPVAVYAFGRSADYARVAPAGGEPAFSARTGGQAAIAVDARAPDAREAAFHAYVHLQLESGAQRRVPAWYDEGLAQFFGAAAFDGERATIGLRPSAIGLRILYGAPLSLRKMLTTVDRRHWSAETATMFRVESWALAHYFYLGERAGYAKRGEQLVDYLARTARGEPEDAAFAAAFGTSMDSLEPEFLRYMASATFPYVQRASSALAVDSLVPALVPADEISERLGELALASDRYGEARTRFEQALQANPDQARAQAGLGVARADAGEPDDALFARASALAPRDAEIPRLRGDALLAAAERATQPGQDSRLAQARSAYEASLALDPANPAAQAGLGRTLAWAGDPQVGIQSLERAGAALPLADAELAALARLTLRAGRTAEARARVQILAQRPHGSRSASAALDALIADTGLLAEPRGADPSVSLRMEVQAPADEQHIGGIVGIAEVRGRAALGEVLDHDVVIALDESGSTLRPIPPPPPEPGASVAARSSEPRPARIIDAELRAARHLIEQLDPAHARVGVLAFAGGTHVIAPLGPPAAALASIDRYQIHRDETGTSLARPLAQALEVFFAGRLAEQRRIRSVLLLSDGIPFSNEPGVSQRQVRREAPRVSHELGEAGVRVYTFAIGPEAVQGTPTFREIAAQSDGLFVPVEDPARVTDVLTTLNLSGVGDVAIRNAATGEAARALRVFPDGSFDALVPLARGANTLEIVASAPGVPPVQLERRVYFEPPDTPSRQDLVRAEELRERLRVRTLETELARLARSRAPRAERPRRVDVAVEPPDPEAHP